jgi:hypothetical protein
MVLEELKPWRDILQNIGIQTQEQVNNNSNKKI